MQTMSLGFREVRARRKRQRRWQLLKWVAVFAGILAAGFYSYETGSRLTERAVERLEEEIEVLNTRIQELEQDNDRLAEAARTAKVNVQEWQQRYRKDIPSGELKSLYERLRQKLANGVPSDRLSFVLDQTSDRKDCANDVETKRFYVKTPLYEGGNDAVGFADSTIIVTAKGANSTDSSGNQRARYDPAQAVVIRFARLGGEAVEAQGVLPLHHAMVIGDKEYRFSVVAGEAGMVKVTAGNCPFP